MNYQFSYINLQSKSQNPKFDEIKKDLKAFCEPKPMFGQ